MRVANLTPFLFTGWARGTTDAGLLDPGTALVGDGCRAVRGLRTGLETQAVDVLLTLAPWEERDLDPSTLSALAYPFPPPADPLSHFGGPLTCNGEPMAVRSFRADGAAWTTHCTARVGELFHVDVWLRWYPGEAHAVGECMVTASKAGSPALTDICPGIAIGFGDGIVQGMGLPVGAPIVAAGEQFGDGQARLVPFSVLWVRNVTDASQWASYQAAKDGGIVVRGCRRSFADGNVTFPQGFDARAWAAQHWGRAVALLHSWDSPALGPAADSGQTGAQEDQCFRGVESLLPDGAGAQLVNYLAAFDMANRPCHHLEADGSVVDAARRPGLRMFYSRPHRSGSDMLGKPRDLTLAEARGWNGPDAQHWFFSRLAMAARFTGSPACQRLLEHQARNYLIQLTTTPGAATSAIWSARELGWEGIAVVHLWRELADRGLADRVREHWHRRANWLASKLPVSGPWDIRVDDDRLGTGSWWMPWQQSIGAYGLDLACRVLGDGGSHLPLIAANGAKIVVDSAYDGTTEYELLALDGRRSRSGMFSTSWLPLAVAMRARDDVRAVALLAHIRQQAGGDGRWIPPTS